MTIEEAKKANSLVLQIENTKRLLSIVLNENQEFHLTPHLFVHGIVYDNDMGDWEAKIEAHGALRDAVVAAVQSLLSDLEEELSKM